MEKDKKKRVESLSKKKERKINMTNHRKWFKLEGTRGY